MDNTQQSFFEEMEPIWEGMPTTRYQGSKRKLLQGLFETLSELKFSKCLDAFGGTGSVTHLLRKMGKSVQFNDILPSNCNIAKALFSEGPISLKVQDIKDLLVRNRNRQYKSIIEDNYKDIYFLDEENRELDTFCHNIGFLKNETAQCEAYYLLFQAMLCKRPYNLFHRANLHMRTKEVERSFGNKVTWEKPFIEHMLKFHKELSNYREFQKGGKVSVTCGSAFELKGKYDLVYIDTPYAKSFGPQESNYFDFYHFLDAILEYENIPKLIVPGLKHKPIYEFNKPWHPCPDVLSAFRALFEKYYPATLVISYRSDGHPTPAELLTVLSDMYSSVEERHLGEYKYVLSTRKSDTKEVVLLAKDPKVWAKKTK